MSKTRKTLLSTYHYDPLDRLSGTHVTQRFYNITRIAMEIEGDRKTRFFEADAQPLALQQHGSAPGATLLATDLQTSVLSGIGPDDNPHAQAFTPFGHHANDALLSVMGFNGERPDPVTGHYLLGQGYRAFNPVLMRFNSPDSWSPFGEGGINTYTYCDNEPVMRQDSNGHLWGWVKTIGRAAGIVDPSSVRTARLNSINSAELRALRGKSDPLSLPEKYKGMKPGALLNKYNSKMSRITAAKTEKIVLQNTNKRIFDDIKTIKNSTSIDAAEKTKITNPMFDKLDKNIRTIKSLSSEIKRLKEIALLIKAKMIFVRNDIPGFDFKG